MNALKNLNPHELKKVWFQEAVCTNKLRIFRRPIYQLRTSDSVFSSPDSRHQVLTVVRELPSDLGMQTCISFYSFVLLFTSRANLAIFYSLVTLRSSSPRWIIPRSSILSPPRPERSPFNRLIPILVMEKNINIITFLTSPKGYRTLPTSSLLP